MKSTGTIEAGTGLWYSPNQDATNSSGFTGLPGSLRNLDGTFSNGGYGKYGYWWSSTPYDSTAAWLCYLTSSDGLSKRIIYGKKTGFSVRCLRD